MFAFLLIITSFQFFANGQVFEPKPIHDFDLVNSNLQNVRVEGNGNAQAEKLFRLPKDVKPVLYNLKMVPNLFGNFTFSGEVDIKLILQTSTSNIVMHSYNLNINSVEVLRNKRKIESNYNVSLTDQSLTIKTKQKMFRLNDIQLIIKFNGSLTDEMKGFYRSSYKVGNTTKWLAITQFEPTYARWAFPCFDEPAYRAVFNISIARYPYQKAMSNMPLSKTSNLDQSIGNRVWDNFQATPPLPTYLVAFGVSEFNYRTNAAEVVRVWARENAMNDTAYPLAQAVSALRNMEAFVGIPYALPKLDVVAVPDFKSGAMENWGLTTYRERYSLFNEKYGNERNKEVVTSVIAHEFAHQWFGDLVTLAWWDYLWLNEGFATYFEYFLTDIVEPTWRENEIFIVEALHYALNIDGIFTHRSMNSKVTSLSDINAKFDGISYDKAGCVIRMIEHVVSRSTFKKALQLYLKARSNSVAEPSNLYESFEEQLDKEGKIFPNKVTITKVWKSFVDQPGYPCILVSRKQVVDRCNITIKQVTYVSPRSSQNITQKTWIVPLTCTKQSQPDFNNTQPTMWLVDENQIVLSNEVRKDEWYICNLQQSGYFRVNYDEENWDLLIKQLHSSPLKIHQLNRAQLINDASTFAKDGFLPHKILFNLLGYLSHETDPIPWYRGLVEINNLIKKHDDSKAFGELQHFFQHIVGHFYSHIGFYEKSNDSHSVKTVRSQLLFVACDLEIEEPNVKAKSEFSSRTADLSQIPAYMKETVLCVAIKNNSDEPTWNKLWDLYRNSSYEYERVTVLQAVGCAKNETLLKKYIHKIADKKDHDIRKQDEVFVFRSLTRFSRGVTAMINYVHDVLPNITNCNCTRKMVLRLLDNIMGQVHTHQQIHRLDHVIEEAEKLDQEKFKDVKESLAKIKEKALKLKAKIDDEAEKIYVALSGPRPTPKPSSASIFVPQTLILIVAIFSALKLNI